jgi:hypothetical protein
MIGRQQSLSEQTLQDGLDAGTVDKLQDKEMRL